MIRLNDIEKSYTMGLNVVRALDGVSLAIEPGEFVAILGPSGSGKSTLMNIIGCIDTPDKGAYILDGDAVEGLDDDDLAVVRNAKVGFVFQRFNLLSKYTALHNVAMPLLLRGMSMDEAAVHAEAMLTRVGLGDRIDHKPMELSGGQQQRVAIARAMVTKPGILLADEPTGALDSKSGKEIIELFHELHAEGATLVVITHDIDVAKEANRIVHIRDGKIVEDETTRA